MDPNQQPVQPTPPPQPSMPQTPSSYTAPVQEYDPNYLDSIAPPPQQGKFLSGTFGKVFWILVGVFVLAVSLIIAFSGKDETADLQQVSVRLDNFSKTAKTVQKNLKSKTLTSNNSTFQVWLVGNQTAGEALLKKGGVSKTEYNKTMVKSEAKLASDLDAKFEDARLSARLNRVYASTMAAETQKIINMLNTMAKKNKSKQIREYASTASANLVPIQKIFDDYTETAN